MLGCVLAFVLGPATGFGHGDAAARDLAAHAYYDHWGVVPARLLHGPVRGAWTLVTALFVHGGWPHLLGNMLFLYVFGALVEERLGRLHYALFYVAAGALALLGYALANGGSQQALVGASGAISAVLGAFLRLFPGARVTSLFPFLFFLPLRFPAWVVLPFWLALQWLAARGADGAAGAGGVAYLAHLIGFALGFGYAWTVYGRGAGRRAGGYSGTPARASEGDSAP
ncbi:rhomboid family intramembrane serine protease [Streptomyces sp. NPDC050560]|uniref:rhomboid family intramembrane serine protease n=1 Tax=Streptomyces sp. NPDC050560 TaxID=3365630 RepID=UPI003788E2A9